MNVCAASLDPRKKHFEPPYDKTNKMTVVPSEESDQSGHPPSLIRVFDVRSMDAQADLSLRWAHKSFCWFCHAVAQFSY